MNQLTDSFGRTMRYLRLSVTDRCNLRCFYCMPHEGIDFLPRNQLLTYEELLRLTSLLAAMGISKVRITGGEPFIRKELIGFLEKLTEIHGISKVSITTNGILTGPFIPDLKRLGIHQINLSLDTLDEANFRKITRREDYLKVIDTFHRLLAEGFDVKINAVIMDGINDHEIPALAQLAYDYPVTVRFIEEMPFNGSGRHPEKLLWDFPRILETLRHYFHDLKPISSESGSTAENFHVEGAKGNFGIIAAYTRSFCGSCDRLRITSTGSLRTCLYGADTLNLKEMLRIGAGDADVIDAINNAVRHKSRDGFIAEKERGLANPIGESMAGIGG